METNRPTVEDLAEEFSLAWQGLSGKIDSGAGFSENDYKDNESVLLGTLNEAQNELIRFPHTPNEYRAVKARMLPRLARIGVETFGLSLPQVEFLLGHGLPQAAIDFMVMARGFNCISDAEIFQASRNVGVMNVLQLLFGQQCRMTPAVFAYSMLYPCTDNYLDDPAVPLDSKRDFVQRFGRRLAGQVVSPRDSREELIFDLVGMIERDIDRRRRPGVYEGLVAIHQAQSGSLALAKSKSPTLEDILNVSIRKGGASVLADGYLVAGGHPDPEQMRFLFGLGFFLQLVDDLQDIAQDREKGNSTIFTYASVDPSELEMFVDRTIQFGDSIWNYLELFATPAVEPLKEIFRFHAGTLVIAAAIFSQRFFRKEYLQGLEAHFPFRFAFLNKLHSNLKRHDFSFTRLLDLFVEYEKYSGPDLVINSRQSLHHRTK